MDDGMDGGMDGWWDGWMIGWMMILVSKLGGCFLFFPKATCQLCWTGVQCPNASFLDSIQRVAILHAQTVQRPCCNKQTNGCTWVDENPQALFSLFLLCLLACWRTLNTHLQTLRVSVWWHTSCSEPSQAHQPSHGCKIGGSYSTPMAHNWIACRACLWHPPTSGNNNNNNNNKLGNRVWIWTHQIPEFIGNWTHHKQSVIRIRISSLSLSFFLLFLKEIKK